MRTGVLPSGWGGPRLTKTGRELVLEFSAHDSRDPRATARKGAGVRGTMLEVARFNEVWNGSQWWVLRVQA